MLFEVVSGIEFIGAMVGSCFNDGIVGYEDVRDGAVEESDIAVLLNRGLVLRLSVSGLRR